MPTEFKKRNEAPKSMLLTKVLVFAQVFLMLASVALASGILATASSRASAFFKRGDIAARVF